MKKISFIFAVILVLEIWLGNVLVFAQADEWERQIEQDPENKTLLLKLGKYYHDIGGSQEDKHAVNKAEKYLCQFLNLDSKHGLALVYYGSVLTMKARDAFFPWDKMKYVKKGISRMDKAVYFEPDNPEVRLIRGINSISLPSMFNRFSCGLEDFKHIEQLDKEKTLDMTKKFWFPYYFNYGLALWKIEKYAEAREKFLNIIHINPNSDYAVSAREYVEKMEEKDHEK